MIAIDRLVALIKGHPLKADLARGASMSDQQLSHISTEITRNPRLNTVERILESGGWSWADLDVESGNASKEPQHIRVAAKLLAAIEKRIQDEKAKD